MDRFKKYQENLKNEEIQNFNHTFWKYFWSKSKRNFINALWILTTFYGIYISNSTIIIIWWWFLIYWLSNENYEKWLKEGYSEGFEIGHNYWTLKESERYDNL